MAIKMTEFDCLGCGALITRDWNDEHSTPACQLCGGELRLRPERCTRCGLPIKPGNETMLELSWADGCYRLEGERVEPPEHSQGGFLFGPECKSKPNAPFDRDRYERNLERV